MAPYDENQNRRTVPKFGSFKPASGPSLESDASASSSKPDVRKGEDESRGEKRRRTHRGDHERSRRHRSHPEQHRSRSPLRSGTSNQNPKEEERRGATKADGADLFLIDKKGDPLILRYGTNERSRVPSYFRFGRGRLMGSTQRFEIHLNGPKEEWSFRDHRDMRSIFRDKHLMARLARGTPRRIRQETDGLPRGDEDFIQLFKTNKHKRGDGGPDSSEDDQPNYRSIHGKAKPEDFLESDFESDSNTSQLAATETEVSTMRAKSIELSRRVRDVPGDIGAWLELIELQDGLLREEQGGRPKSQNEARAIADIRASMFEKALEHTKLPAEREKLLIGLMQEGRRLWDSKTLAKRWQEVSESEGESFPLWNAYLDFQLTDMLAFSFEDVRSFFIKRIRFLREQLSKPPEEGVVFASQQIIYVFLRLTRFLHDSGFSELAIAAWQALLEMTFFRPKGIEEPAPAIAALGNFWETEVLRIGEAGAQGWGKFADADAVPTPPDPAKYPPAPAPGTRDQYKAWGLVERDRASASHFPARTLDEGTEDDPYRVVLFSDMEEFLFWLPPSTLPDISSRLQDAFLVFCGLPAAFSTDDITTPSLDNAFTAARSEEDEAQPLQDSGVLHGSVDLSTKRPSFAATGSRIAIAPDVLFASHNWFQYLPKRVEAIAKGESQVDLSWAITVLRQLVRLGGIEQLAEYYLAMECAQEPSSARKVAKALLKQYPSNIRLYNAYALTEWANQNAEVSKKVLVSATKQTLGFAPEKSQVLWNTWAWMELDAGNKHAALARLCQSVEPGLDEHQDVSPTILLKTRSHLCATRDHLLWTMQLEDSLQHAESMVLLEYFAAEDNLDSAASDAQGNITAALRNIESLAPELATRNLQGSSYQERLVQVAARLLYYHATHGPFRPVFIRERLRDFVKLFPRNLMFLRLFAWAESGLRIDDPVNEVLQNVALVAPHDCVSNRIFAIQHAATAGTLHSCRTAFEAALDSDECRGNVSLWIYYIRFCYRSRELRGKAKDVFHRALAACPWSKELYMEAFGTLVGEMSSPELRAVFNTISSKGLRVHVDLEEFVKRWKERQGGSKSR
ncbi:DUF1740-domain-containing protein [Thozetella sp. PMI_491]|nr:DUF1740-domain-containing protein [Thozetella sp. PMI_491]